MSLIHKALQKIEEGRKGTETGGRLVSPEEKLFGGEPKKEFLSTEVTPRTVALIGFTVLAALYAVYTNFVAEKPVKKGAKPSAAAAARPSAPAASSPSAQPLQKKETVVDPAAVSLSGQVSGSSVEKELPADVQALKEEGEKEFLAGKLDAALGKFTEALTKAPESSEILNSLGLVLKKKGNLVEAERYYTQAIKNNPGCHECLNNMAVLCVQKGDSVSAVLHLRKAIEKAETYADPYFNLAVIMEKEGNFKSAVENYKLFLTYATGADDAFKEKVRQRVEDLAMSWE